MEKQIELTPLAEIGHGCARITDESVEIEISGISGGMKAWLIGGDAVPVGNIVSGRLSRKIDTANHNGILITQSGRQMLIGRYSEEEIEKNDEEIPDEDKSEIITENKEEEMPFDIKGFDWKKITGKSFEELGKELRFILSNKSVYDNYKKHKHYWIGECEEGGALALKCDETEVDPLEFMGKMKISKNGYVIVCVDKKTNRLYIPD